jgi:hypothetical protein
MAQDQGFPIINQPFVDQLGNITSAWRQLLVTLWNRTGASGGGGIGTLLVNPGTGTNQRELNVALSDYANVNDYLDTGDVNYDGAFVRALAAKNHAYVPAVPWIADPDNYYHTTATIILQSGQSIVGDGAGVSRIVCDTLDVPTITLWHNVYWYALEGLTIAHLPGAIVGGDGNLSGTRPHRLGRQLLRLQPAARPRTITAPTWASPSRATGGTSTRSATLARGSCRSRPAIPTSSGRRPAARYS